MRRDPHAGAAVPRRIVGFRQDDAGHWVAELSCGHTQHVRHEPPLVTREWTLTEDGRASRIGATLRCAQCREGA